MLSLVCLSLHALPWQDLRDPLAVRRADEDAVCVVCGDGASVAPNVIVFCERCDIGVHQCCYGVATIPAGEWLCWPCLRHEEGLEARGVPRPQIRPPRWQRKARSTLEGGSADTPCALCPNRGGAYRATADGKQWVHEVRSPRPTPTPTGLLCLSDADIQI